MKLFGLIGYPLKNSFSASYFTEKFSTLGLHDHAYFNFPIAAISELPALLKNNPELSGLNVTVPHKVTVLKYLDELDAAAKVVGAVNCIRIRYDKESGTPILKGYNTDVHGFELSLLAFIGGEKITRALVLGTGGSARAVGFVLEQHGIMPTYVTRNTGESLPENTVPYSSLNKQMIEDHLLIVNCTPVGMYPNEQDAPPLPYPFINTQHNAFDLVYFPEETLFLKTCREQGAKTRNGLEMLHLQADEAWKIFNSEP